MRTAIIAMTTRLSDGIVLDPFSPQRRWRGGFRDAIVNETQSRSLYEILSDLIGVVNGLVPQTN